MNIALNQGNNPQIQQCNLTLAELFGQGAPDCDRATVNCAAPAVQSSHRCVSPPPPPPVSRWTGRPGDWVPVHGRPGSRHGVAGLRHRRLHQRLQQEARGPGSQRWNTADTQHSSHMDEEPLWSYRHNNKITVSFLSSGVDILTATGVHHIEH